MEVTYKWKDAANPTESAIAFGEACNEIAEADPDGILHVRKIVERARTDEELHHHFEWDDAVCGQVHREEQARNLIRRIETVPVHTPTRARQVEIKRYPSYQHLRGEGSGYHKTELIMLDDQMRASLLYQAEVDFAAYRRRFERLSELAEAFQQMAGALRRAKRKRPPKGEAA